MTAAYGQPAPARDDKIVTPNFVPAPKRASEATPVRFAEPTTVPPPIKVLPVAVQKPGERYIVKEEEGVDIFQVALPGPQKQFTRISEEDFYKGIGKMQGGRAIFPVEPIISKEPFRPRDFPAMVETVEPSFLLHRRLLFEQPNFERTGWDLGIVQPVVNVGVFSYDLVMLPYHYWSDLHDRSEGNPGKCMPGDQAPLRVPIERFSVTGSIGQVGAIIGGSFLFP